MSPHPASRILLLRPSAPGYTAIGNLVVSLPAMRLLREAFPDAWMCAVVDPLGDEILESVPWINERLVYEPLGRHRGALGYASFLRAVRLRRFDVAVAFKRFLRSHLMAWLSGAAVRVGFRPPPGWDRWEDALARRLLTHEVPYDEDRSLVELNADLVRALGIEGRVRPPSLRPLPADRRRVEEWLGAERVAGRYLVVHGGGVSERAFRYPREALAEAARTLARALRVRPLVLAGPGEEMEAGAIARALPGGRVASGLRIREAAELLRRAVLFVGSDSGPSHLAAGVGTPEVVLYGPPGEAAAKMRRWLPPGPRVRGLAVDASASEVVAAGCALAGPRSGRGA